MIHHRNVLVATTVFELKKRYAGSAFGLFWVILYPALLLGVYIFVYMVVFKVRFPDMGEYQYVLYVFSGLVPYLGLMDALNSGASVVRQNMHLVKSVMLPIDLVPVRTVLITMISQSVTMTILLVMAAVGGTLGPHLLWLPVVLILQFLFFLGLICFIAPLGVMLPDVQYFIGLFLLLLLFLTPVGFRPEMLSGKMTLMVTLNPVYYLIEVVRCSVLYGRFPDPTVSVVFVALCAIVFAAGAAFFLRFKNFLTDYE